VQRLTEFLGGKVGDPVGRTSFLPGVRHAELKEVLPPFVITAMKSGFAEFERKMPGFITKEATLFGVETRTSSPVRIVRDETGQSVSTTGLFPCGEGAGYAGGIISSALDGIRAAEHLVISLGVPVHESLEDEIIAPVADLPEGEAQGVIHLPNAQIADCVEPLANDFWGEDHDQAIGQFFLQKRVMTAAPPSIRREEISLLPRAVRSSRRSTRPAWSSPVSSTSIPIVS